jgi:hypothetical protein
MEVSAEVFGIDRVFNGSIPTGDDWCRFDAKPLEDIIKKIVRENAGHEGAIMADISGDGVCLCPTFVVSTPAIAADGPPKCFRSYKLMGVSPDQCAIWEAARATTAAPSFFRPVFIGTPAQCSEFGLACTASSSSSLINTFKPLIFNAIDLLEDRTGLLVGLQAV